MESQVNRMLAEGVIQVSTSPWWAQDFVVRDGPKQRMVIDYSQTINRHTSKDAFPFPNMQDLLDQAAENTTFSKIDLKSALRRQSGKNGDCNKSVVVLCGFLNCIITHAFQELTKVE